MTSMRRSRCRAALIACGASASLDRGTRVFSRTEGAALTAEQKKALGRYRARWSAIRRSTEPADCDAAEECARLAYCAAGLTPPQRFVWCGSPFELSRRTQRIAQDDGPNVRWTLIDRVRRRVTAQIKKRL